jgi:putative redox protein
MVTPAKPPVRVDLTWDRELVFTGTSGEVAMTLDSAGVAGPSPVQALAFALAGCMAMDVAHIVQKGRHPLTALGCELTGERAQQDPHRLTNVTLHFTVSGAVPADAVQRAIDLSREKYCSVWHSLRQDIGLAVTFEVSQ